MIIALAGRRVDAADAPEARFPLRNLELVKMRIREMLRAQAATLLVSAAACGADLLALSEAGGLGIRRRVVLPFERERFKETSVTDRPGNWGPLYEKVMDEVEAGGDLVIAKSSAEGKEYVEGNLAIIDEAIRLGREMRQSVTAAMIWDGSSRGDDDITEQFGAEAGKRGLPLIEVRTI